MPRRKRLPAYSSKINALKSNKINKPSITKKKKRLIIKKPYRIINMNNITSTNCYMNNSNKIYKKGDIIHYKGKCQDWNDFYAKINHVTKKGMNITKLNSKKRDSKLYLYLTKNTKKGLTRRKFTLLK